jgi:hypothetical protein
MRRGAKHSPRVAQARRPRRRECRKWLQERRGRRQRPKRAEDRRPRQAPAAGCHRWSQTAAGPTGGGWAGGGGRDGSDMVHRGTPQRVHATGGSDDSRIVISPCYEYSAFSLHSNSMSKKLYYSCLSFQSDVNLQLKPISFS